MWIVRFCQHADFRVSGLGGLNLNNVLNAVEGRCGNGENNLSRRASGCFQLWGLERVVWVHSGPRAWENSLRMGDEMGCLHRTKLPLTYWSKPAA